MSKYRKKQQQQNGPFAYFMGALCCVGLPAFVTAVAPVTYLSFQRHENTVTATARICFFFVVPYATKSQTNVANVGTRHHAGTYERKPGETHHVKSEDESFLVVQSPEGTFDVSVSPVNINDKLSQAEAFLADPSAKSLKLTCVSNWKFAVFAGGTLSLLTLAYLFGVLVAIAKRFK
ncbi:MAG: hypothetical protein KDC35_17410 [Acidobacteria bacterium]|nr:hypothetical protein [Acidobacteriota bacterium]